MLFRVYRLDPDCQAANTWSVRFLFGLFTFTYILFEIWHITNLQIQFNYCRLTLIVQSGQTIVIHVIAP